MLFAYKNKINVTLIHSTLKYNIKLWVGLIKFYYLVVFFGQHIIVNYLIINNYH